MDGLNLKDNFVHIILMSCVLMHTVHGSPPARVCIEYNNGNDLKNNGTNKTCPRSHNQCFIVWVRVVKNGKEHITLLKQGCWTYENNERESCGNTKCVSIGSYDRSNNTEFCCCQTDLCNRKFISTKKYDTTKSSSLTLTKVLTYHAERRDTMQERQLFTGIISAACILVVLTSAIVVMFIWKRKRIQKEMQMHINERPLVLPINLQHIRLTTAIRKGTFGEIWLGALHSKTVAIKKFQEFQKRSWESEKKIYSLGLEHPGILKYFGASIYPEKNSTSYILFVEYHPRGSLRHCLGSTTFPWQEMCTMIQSIAEALAYLHGELQKIKKLPCIVHRDISSENILVKEDGSCVICDLGLSLAMSSNEKKEHIVTNGDQKVGSLRYMAPEALEGHINLNDMASQLKQIDVYAMGIVLWEISSRCQDLFQGHVVPDFRLPFEQLESDLTLHSLKHHVLVRKMRPPFPEIWNKNNQSVKILQELINDCWDQDAEARLSASCVCQRVIQLKQQHTNNP